MSNIVRLDVNLLHLAVLNHDGITLASVCAQEGCSWEFEVQGAGELSALVTKEADSAAFVFIKLLAPCVHTERFLVSTVVRISYTMDGEKEHHAKARRTYTKASLTETTKTLPASLSLECLR